VKLQARMIANRQRKPQNINLVVSHILSSLFAEQHNFRKAYKYDEIASDTFFY
jgi:hypothetical protein